MGEGASGRETSRIATSASPYFRPEAKAGAFALAFAVFLGVQVGAVLHMYGSSRHSVGKALDTRLVAVARSAAPAVADLLAMGATPDEIGLTVRRIRESNNIGDACLVDENLMIVASTWGASPGTPASVLALRPSLVRETLRTNDTVAEEVDVLGEPHHRVYQPVRAGERTLVLCLESFDPLPQGVAALRAPLAAGLAASFIAALLLAFATLAVMKLFDRAKSEMIRVERLATVGEMAASIAHEIRNPMSSVLANAQYVAAANDLPPKSRAALSDIEEEVKRADSQLDAFLDLSRDMPLRPAEEDVGALLRTTADFMAARARQGGVSLEVDAPENPLRASIDRRKMRQVLVNLILNSLEATAGHGSKVWLAARAEVGEGGRSLVAIEIDDDGPGIPEDARELVWQPFYSGKPNGTGLGLPQARKIIERHGGTISLESTPGKGTKVTIRLPAGEGVPPCES